MKAHPRFDPTLDLEELSKLFFKLDDKGRTYADTLMVTLSEIQLRQLLIMEAEGRKSTTAINRIHKRFTKLRAEREREILHSSKIPGIPSSL